MPVNDNTYNVNFNKLISWLIPNELFKPKFFAWCKVIVNQLSLLQGEFISFRKQKLYELSITPQIGKLTKLLNDRLDYVQRRIYIKDGKRGENVYIFQDDEDDSLYLFNDTETETTYVFNDNEVGATPAHFIVYIPSNLTAQINIIKSLVNTYKLPSKRYQIQTF